MRRMSVLLCPVRRVLRTMSAIVLLPAVVALGVRASPEFPARPNIVFILADDLGWGDLGSFGQREIDTPHLDRMAVEGLRFTHAYAGSTVCAPSRAALMTGQHTGRTSVRGNRRPDMTRGYYLGADDTTIASVLRDAGYATAAIGKWGLGFHGREAAGMPDRQGFDYFFGYLNQTHAHNSYPSHLFRNDTRVDLPNTVPDELPNGAGVSDNRLVFAQDLFIDEALHFIRAPRAEPFFLYFAPTLPHANNEAEPFGLEIPNYGPYASRDWPEAKKALAAMISRLDHDVGRILAELRARGIAEDTLVIFSSDNGPHKEAGGDPAFFVSSGPFQGRKRSLHEGGIRVPTIAWQPGTVPAGRVSEEPWYFPDLFPTFAALAHGSFDASRIDGMDIRRVLLGGREPELRRRLMYWEFHEGGFACAARRGNWKAILKKPGTPLELYDLATDPGETRDLASHFPEVAAQMAAAMRAARTESPEWPAPSGY
jgi:arylsulfatase A-like enzyme